MNIQEILSQLTIEEKIRLLNGDGDWHNYDCNGKIPTVMMTDGPHGLRKVEVEKVGDINGSKPATCFPTASAIAASWNPEVSAKMARAIAKEAINEDISIVLGCGTNIKRSPLCGRNFEYFSEDPFLAGEMAASYIKAMENCGVGTSLKHFAGNSQETRRMTSNSQIDERALREIYLPAFEKAVKDGKPSTVMASYNKINNEPGAGSKKLLTDILRNEWGYKGSVISDWGACIGAVKCFKSGLNLEMPDSHGFHTKILTEAYNKGEITADEIDALAANVLENIVSFADKKPEKIKVDFDEQNLIAREIENECAVLLKNDGLLPLSKDKKIVIVGSMADHMRFQGGGSSHINVARSKNAIDALKEAGYEVIYVKGYRDETDEPDEKLVKEALTTVKENSGENTVVLFFMGLTDSFEGEGYDRTTLDVPGNQIDLLERISGIVGISKVAAITFGGAPMDYSWDENVSATLHMYLGGQAVGESVADLVSGKCSPSGKLAETVPLAITDTPAWRYFGLDSDDVEYRESIFVGYRYYETYGVEVKYPFGYGLSYSKFNYSDLNLPEVYENGEIEVSLTVENTGNCEASDVVEVYVMPEKENFMRSKTELKGFTKVSLKPGEKKKVSVKLNERSFSVYDVNSKDFCVISGVYEVAVGSSVKDIKLRQNIVVNGKKYSVDEKELYPDYFKPQPHGMEIGRDQFESLYGAKLSEYHQRKRGDYDMTCSFGDVSKHSLIGKIIHGIIGIGIRVMFAGQGKDSPEAKMIRFGIEEGALEGLIGSSGGMVSPKLVDFLVLNANRKYGKAFIRLFKK